MGKKDRSDFSILQDDFPALSGGAKMPPKVGAAMCQAALLTLLLPRQSPPRTFSDGEDTLVPASPMGPAVSRLSTYGAPGAGAPSSSAGSADSARVLVGGLQSARFHPSPSTPLLLFF